MKSYCDTTIVLLLFVLSQFAIVCRAVGVNSETQKACDWHILAANLSSRVRSDHDVQHHKIPLLPAYWISLAENTDRHAHMEGLLKGSSAHHQGIGTHTRVDAIKPDSHGYRISKLEKPCNRNTEKDLAIILSHLSAMHRAVHAKDDSEYALILEDDVYFPVSVDFRKVVESAPSDFGILQLVTTNSEALRTLHEGYSISHKSELWTRSLWTDKTKNGKYTLYWGAIGYIVNKKVIKRFIDDVIEEDNKGGLSFKIVNSFNQNQCKRTKERPCILANCLFSDSYLYSGGGPTYVANFPLLTSGGVGLNSTTHQNQVSAHIEAFGIIDKFISDMRRLPKYLKCAKKNRLD